MPKQPLDVPDVFAAIAAEFDVRVPESESSVEVKRVFGKVDRLGNGDQPRMRGIETERKRGEGGRQRKDRRGRRKEAFL